MIEDMIVITWERRLANGVSVEGAVSRSNCGFAATVGFHPDPRGIPTPEHEGGGNVLSLIIRDGEGRLAYRFSGGEELRCTELGRDLMCQVTLELELRYCRPRGEARGYVPYSDLTDEQRAMVDSGDADHRARAAVFGWGIDKLVNDTNGIVEDVAWKFAEQAGLGWDDLCGSGAR